eukprot:CAMPEP_0114557700 /NCGR_PEP_ID=MMETSP0114-20121206/9973_1 /TAXON_ID=31324 /ORGANISM="Goniomonas sp, Strain m" /LENGTH=387 /DNA_ID=CAMNT_0001743011 /DNA_START=16 /DNA_END=1175 /DNA_ORIENTATION=-
MDPLTKAFFVKLQEKKGNNLCFECNDRRPQWASVTLGCFICLQCSGVHRSLGVHLSYVRSITMDKWTVEQLWKMENAGNKRLKNFLADNDVAHNIAPANQAVLTSVYSAPAVERYRQSLSKAAASAVKRGYSAPHAIGSGTKSASESSSNASDDSDSSSSSADDRRRSSSRRAKSARSRGEKSNRTSTRSASSKDQKSNAKAVEAAAVAPAPPLVQGDEDPFGLDSWLNEPSASSQPPASAADHEDWLTLGGTTPLPEKQDRKERKDSDKDKGRRSKNSSKGNEKEQQREQRSASFSKLVEDDPFELQGSPVPASSGVKSMPTRPAHGQGSIGQQPKPSNAVLQPGFVPQGGCRIPKDRMVGIASPNMDPVVFGVTGHPAGGGGGGG